MGGLNVRSILIVIAILLAIAGLLGFGPLPLILVICVILIAAALLA